jgi:hypothetical protein
MLYLKMDIFYDFVKNNYEHYMLENYTNKLNSRNMSRVASVINNNLNTIYLIKKKPLNSVIFKKLNYPKHMYLFLNGEKVFALEDTNIEPHIKKFDDFLGYKRNIPKKTIENDMPFDPEKDKDRNASQEEYNKVLDKLKNLSDNLGSKLSDTDDIASKINDAKETLHTAMKDLEKKDDISSKINDSKETLPTVNDSEEKCDEISSEMKDKFISSTSFNGSKDGYKFQMGPLGLGYYPDNKI